MQPISRNKYICPRIVTGRRSHGTASTYVLDFKSYEIRSSFANARRLIKKNVWCRFIRLRQHERENPISMSNISISIIGYHLICIFVCVFHAELDPAAFSFHVGAFALRLCTFANASLIISISINLRSKIHRSRTLRNRNTSREKKK